MRGAPDRPAPVASRPEPGEIDDTTNAVNAASQSLAPSGSGPGGWATVAAMATCASAATGTLHGLVDALYANADQLRDAAARYDDSDVRSARRHGYRYE